MFIFQLSFTLFSCVTVLNRDYNKLGSISEYVINGLTGSEGYWRIDWIGYLKYNNGLVRFSQPIFDVFLSELTGHPNEVNLYFKSATNFTKQRKVSLPVGYLTILFIGDIWHKDRFYLSPDYKTVDFKNVQIDEAHCHTIMAKDSIDTDLFYLPFSHHPYHQRATKTYCEVVELENSAVQLIIPHYVILCSYFGSSSTLLAYLFSYGVLLQDLYDNSKSGRNDDGPDIIHLKTKIPDESAAQVARIAWDVQATKAVAMISNQLTLQNNNREAKRLKTAFPFVGRTNLRLSGKWVTRRDGSKAFVVFRIINCSAPYPFEELEFYRDNPGDKNKDAARETRAASTDTERIRPVNQPKTPQELTLTPNEMPNNDSTKLHLKSPHSTLFTDLLTKPVTKVRQEAHKTSVGATSVYVPIEIESGNVGEGGHDKTIAPTLFTQGDKLGQSDGPSGGNKVFKFTQKICRISLFFSALEQLSKQLEILDINYWALNQSRDNREKDCSYFPESFTASGRRSTWQYIDYSRGCDAISRKKRRVVIAEVVTEHGRFCLFEIERRIAFEAPHWQEKGSYTLLLAHHKFPKPLSQSDVQFILQHAAQNKGCWPKATALPHLKLTTMKHPQNDILENSRQDYIATMLRYVKDGTKLL